jgi:hypothetical protein
MDQQHLTDAAIVPRRGPDFGLDGDIPRYWFDNDPFRTRFFDAMSLLFPEGEKFFIACVRDYHDQIKDPALAEQVRGFVYQEGQHGMVHTRFNDRLRAQGIDVDRELEEQKQLLNETFRKRFPKVFTLAQTAASEHLTALMAHGFFATDLMAKADPRIRAMYAWHAIEEIEHKAVAFDVFKQVARGSYLTRISAMLMASLGFPLHVFVIMHRMFKVDRPQKPFAMWLRGLWWLYGWGGLYPRLLPHYFAYFLPGFHPWKHGDMGIHETWTTAFRDSGGNAIAAGDAVLPSAS